MTTLSRYRSAALSILLFLPLVSIAGDKPPKEYKETGKVTSVFSSSNYIYQVETDNRVYRLEYPKQSVFLKHPVEYKVGDRALTVGDSLRFRIDGDWAHLPAATASTQESPEEDKLRVLNTELKVIPPLPAAPDGANQDPKAAKESGVVIGSGVQVHGSRMSWASAPAPAATGGIVTVIPTGTTTAGVPTTGTPVTGGPPVTVIPTTTSTTPGVPVMGTPIGGPAPAGGGMVIGGGTRIVWDHIIRVMTSNRVYDLECPGKKCAALGDNISFRIDKKSLYVAPDPKNPAAEEEKYKILGVSLNGAAKESKAPDSNQKPNPESTPPDPEKKQ